MADETTPKAKAKPKKEKPPALEDKPFTEFIEQHFVPTLKESLTKAGLKDLELTFKQDTVSIPGANSDDPCWQVVGTWNNNQRQFKLYFLDEDIKGQKAFACGVNGKSPSTIESFMIDERKINLDLMVLYVLQRLNAQKWLFRN